MSEDKSSCASNISRWNFEADDESLMVCKGEHEKGEHCEAYMERLSPHDALELINNLRGECLVLAEKLKQLSAKKN